MGVKRGGERVRYLVGPTIIVFWCLFSVGNGIDYPVVGNQPL